MTTLAIIGQEATRALTREDVLRVIESRRQQIASHREALREWQLALTAADRLWTEHPDWSFGQCLDAIHAANSYNTANMEGKN